ncbi:MAG: L-fucose/L-arabinose isomerase family protein [Bryobacterales bacterium]|nr:L-fucose/L-arabinose isomerase family protein [Bryobacteraceae bacterium]MDW8356051.1 L-fucose/L-arabinose isomerase family protein [Bryobacterales bacterium]
MDHSKPRARVGVFAVGLAAYWPQFPGLKERLETYLAEVERRIAGFQAELVRGGLVDTAPAARQIGELFARQGVDLLICHTATYATSAQVLPIVQQTRAPVLVLNLQPAAALDYERTDTAEWLANCSACCVPEISNAFARSGISFHVVSGMLYEDPKAWTQIEQWCRAASAARALRTSRLGFLGHTYPGMLDMYSDFTMVHGQLGAHVEVLEMCDLARRVARVTEAEIERKLEETTALFELDPGVAPEDLRWAARVAVGLDRLVADFDLDGLAYYYRGLDGNEYERLAAGMILGNSLLTARGIPASGEGDLKNCIAMLLMDRLGAGGSYTEFYAMDFRDHFVLMGHDGPGHIAISDRRPVLRSLQLYHGKRGYGISVEFNVKTGPVTILGMTQTAQGRFKFVAAEGESLPGPILRIGNTNSRIRFSLPPAEFVNRWCAEGPTHHCALGVGHRRGEIEKLAALLQVPLAWVG